MEANANMSAGKIGSPDIIFGRKFRWLLEGNDLRSDFTKSVNFDFINKTINIEYYDVMTKEEAFHVIAFVENLTNKSLNFTLLDGFGYALCYYAFHELSLMTHTSNFDYESSDVSTQNITIKYEKVDKKINQYPTYPTRVKEKVLTETDVTIDEIQLSHLNETITLPGRIYRTIRNFLDF